MCVSVEEVCLDQKQIYISDILEFFSLKKLEKIFDQADFKTQDQLPI
jgi:hypothetical protein